MQEQQEHGVEADRELPWKRYPYTPDWGDPAWFTFPYTDGGRRELGTSIYFIEGFLRGHSSGRQYAFFAMFSDMRVLRRFIHTSIYTFALFDCTAARYGTYTHFDVPRPFLVRRRHRLRAAAHHLELRYEGPAGASRWEPQRTPYGDLRPFAWNLELHGRDQQGDRMALTLAAEATRPPAPPGGKALGGEIMFQGLEQTYAYMQSGLRMRGRLRWGDVEEDVDGVVGAIDRRWSVEDLAAQQDWRNTRYRHEWRVLHLDNGWDLSCLRQYHRHQRNAVVPWSGCTAQGPGPAFRLEATHHVSVTIPAFTASPGIVRAHDMLTEGPRYFPQSYRLEVPAWDAELTAEPYIDAPAHGAPVEYWMGPVRIRGRMFGRAVTGYGFDERTRPWVRDFELAVALRETLEQRPEVDAAERQILVWRMSEVEGLALRGDPRAAVGHFRRYVLPLIASLPHAARSHLSWLARDLVVVLERKFPPPR